MSTTCKTGLKKNVISKKVFEKELLLCHELSKKNGGGCCWGECKNCGVTPFLYKLHKGVIIHEPKELAKIRSNVT